MNNSKLDITERTVKEMQENIDKSITPHVSSGSANNIRGQRASEIWCDDYAANFEILDNESVSKIRDTIMEQVISLTKDNIKDILNKYKTSLEIIQLQKQKIDTISQVNSNDISGLFDYIKSLEIRIIELEQKNKVLIASSLYNIDKPAFERIVSNIIISSPAGRKEDDKADGKAAKFSIDETLKTYKAEY